MTVVNDEITLLGPLQNAAKTTAISPASVVLHHSTCTGSHNFGVRMRSRICMPCAHKIHESASAPSRNEFA